MTSPSTVAETNESPLGPPAALTTPTGVTVVVDEIQGGVFSVVTPCGNPAVVTSGTSIYEARVVIDPGHGGPIDTGAVAPTGLIEKDLNLSVAFAVQAELERRGISAVLTRTADYATPLSVRSELADALRTEMMISIHHNAPTPGPSSQPGVEIFIQSESDESALLGSLLYEETVASLEVFDVSWSAAPDAGVMTVLNTRGDDAYGILRNPTSVSVLLELGYLSNRDEAELFDTPIYKRVASLAIADAAERYLEGEGSEAGVGEGRIFNPRPGVGRDVCDDPALE